MLVLAAGEQFLSAGGTVRAIFSHWKSLVATNAGTLRSLWPTPTNVGRAGYYIHTHTHTMSLSNMDGMKQ
jgi:hypothetical protein